MKKFIVFGLMALGLFSTVNAESQDLLIYMELKDINLSPLTSYIKLNDIGAEEYVITASCKDDGTTITGAGDYGDKIDLCDTGRTVKPTGKDVIVVGNYIFATKESQTSAKVHVSAIDEDGNTIKSSYMNVNLKNVKGDDIETDVKKLNLQIDPGKGISGSMPVIKWNNIDADYYILSASCKDGVYTNGKARPDLCVESEKISGTAKDVLRVDDVAIISKSGKQSPVRIEVSAYKEDEVVASDHKNYEIKSKDHVYSSDEKPTHESPYKDSTKDIVNSDLSESEKIDALMKLLVEIIQQLLTLKNKQ